MLENLNIPDAYEGFVFLAESFRKPGFVGRTHHHRELEFNLVLEGEIVYELSGEVFHYQKGDLMWLFPRQEHRLVSLSPDCRYYVAVFKPAMIQDLLSQANKEQYAHLTQQDFSGKGLMTKRLPTEAFDFLTRSLDALIVDGLDPDLLNREAGFGLSPNFRYSHEDPLWLNTGLRHTLLLAWRLFNDKALRFISDATPHPAVMACQKLIQSSEESMNLNEIARKLDLSASYLSRLFQKETGISISAYRQHLKLIRFWQFYRDQKEKNLLEAALHAGFGSYSQFYRVFSSKYGQNPGDMLERD